VTERRRVSGSISGLEASPLHEDNSRVLFLSLGLVQVDGRPVEDDGVVQFMFVAHASIVGAEKPRRDLRCGQFDLSLSRLDEREVDCSPKEPEIMLT